jgi:phage tail sheath protein FI
MSIIPTFPGVYIQEIPSGVKTITGVATSIAAFIGYTEQGVTTPVHIFSLSDYERAFGGLTLDSPLSYAVTQFFQNGGSEAYVVRVASGAASATLTLNGTNGNAGIVVTAISPGNAGNLLQLDIDYNTANPQSLFNMTVTQYVNRNGQLAPGAVETYRNLSLNNASPTYFYSAIHGISNLIDVGLDGGVNFAAATGTSTSGSIPPASLAGAFWANPSNLTVSIDGAAPTQVQIAGGNAVTDLASAANQLALSLQGTGPNPPTTAAHAATNTIVITSGQPSQRSSIRVLSSPAPDAAPVLRLGVANGGMEIEGASVYRPMQNGTAGGALPNPLPAFAANGTIGINVKQAGVANPLNGANPIAIQLWTNAPPANNDDLLTAINAAFAATANPLLARGRAEIDTAADGTKFLRILPGNPNPNVWFGFVDAGADTTAASLNLIGGASRNFGHYALGSGAAVAGITSVAAATVGANGTPPAALADFGDPSAKTGIYGLDNVDIFNIMCLPDVGDVLTLAPVYPQALAYCILRRAMMIIDPPSSVVDIPHAQTWLAGLDSGLTSSNAAAYFPRFVGSDPLNNTTHQFPNCGALAGIWARTDANRGVWKAPAGTEAQIGGATGLSYRMNNQENGVLNPLGLNCLRTFPVYGTVVWGARTMRGADALDDDYKYIPVRRLALFLEESLYRGTQWVVFEPNDEPLWAQIRLAVGSFMHDMFRKGAFAGQTPKEAYFVKCDDETTIPYDQDNGRVNIIVGYAPLRPAEFVIIQIQQIVSAGPT